MYTIHDPVLSSALQAAVVVAWFVREVAGPELRELLKALAAHFSFSLSLHLPLPPGQMQHFGLGLAFGFTPCDMTKALFSLMHLFPRLTLLITHLMRT